MYIYRLAGFPVSLGFPISLPLSLSPSLRLPGFTRDICIVIAQDNCIPYIFSKLDAEIVSRKTPPHEWVGMTGYKMNLFSQQFMKFQELLKFGLLQLPPETPPPWCGVGKLFWVRMIPGSIRTCVPNLVAVRRSCRKNGGGGTDRHTRTPDVSSLTDYP